jgi:hypothetical protein
MKIELAAKDQQISQLRLRIFELQELPSTIEELREEIENLRKVRLLSINLMRLYQFFDRRMQS